MLEERKALALKLLKQGISRQETARQAGLGKETVHRLAKLHHIRILKPCEYNRSRPIITRCPNGHLIKTKECLQCKIEKLKQASKLSGN